jgi:serine/threonine-protein kinase
MSTNQPTPPAQTDRNLLFGVLALQADLLDASQFAEACTIWSACKDRSLADLLVERGWISVQDRGDVERLLERKLKKHAGDPHASLAAALGKRTRELLAAVADPDIRKSLAGLPAGDGAGTFSTVEHTLQNRGRYTLSRVHARGGIGQVWLARDDDLGREVALKEIREDRADQESVRARFLLEARITGQLEHPGIVPVYELARPRADGDAFYTMRFVKGRTLREASRDYHRKRAAGQAGPLDLRELLSQFLAVCNAVAYAHSRGVVHRDLKGQNVVLGDFGEVIVLDWGLAKVLGKAEGEPVSLDPVGPHGETVHGQVVGTPGYMSPEQAAGRADLVSERSDVYGLGAILYEILTGEPPFAGEDTDEVIRRVLEESPAPPRALVPKTPPALETVCGKALAKHPAARYGSAAELAGEIRHYLADEPLAAYREPRLARWGRWARRHRSLVAGLAAAALVAVLSLTAATVLLSAANRREAEARRLAQEHSEQADRERARAQANFRLARAAVEEYGTKVSNDPRLKEKDLEALRKELLRSAVKFHQQFIKQRGDDPALRGDLGQAYLELARLQLHTEVPARAIEVSRQAAAIYRRLVLEYPEDGDHPLQLGLSLIALGSALDKDGQTGEARTAYARAVETLDAEVQRRGISLPLRRALIRACNHLSFLLIHRLGAEQEALAVYRKAIAVLRREGRNAAPDPSDDVAKADVYSAFGGLLVRRGQKQEGQLWCARALQTIQPLTAGGELSSRTHSLLSSVYGQIGRAHDHLSDYPRALEAFRKAVDHDLQLVAAHPAVSIYQQYLGTDYYDLGRAQIKAGQRQQGLVHLKKSLDIKQKLVARYPEVPDFTANLARSLDNLATHVPDPEQAWAYQRRAESLLRKLSARHPKVVTYQETLAQSISQRADLHAKANQSPERLAALDQGIDVLEGLVKTTDNPVNRKQLLQFYLAKTETHLLVGQPVPAAAAFRKALALEPTNSSLLYQLGTELIRKGRLDEAALGLARAVALKPEFAEAHCNLGLCLLQKGRFVEGRAALRRGHEQGIRRTDWSYPSVQWLAEADRLVLLDARLTAVLEGKAQPKGRDEQLALAYFCHQAKRWHGSAARFFAAALDGKPPLVEALKARHRYAAAQAAALAGCGRGEDASQIDPGERARWRQQAHAWLGADLRLWARQADGAGPADRAVIRKNLARWQTDPDLEGVRAESALAGLPPEERADWQKLWAAVEATVGKAR